jgi:hypothetical protein
MSANPYFSQAKLKELAEATVVRQEKENKQLEAYRKKEKDRGVTTEPLTPNPNSFPQTLPYTPLTLSPYPLPLPHLPSTPIYMHIHVYVYVYVYI